MSATIITRREAGKRRPWPRIAALTAVGLACATQSLPEPAARPLGTARLAQDASLDSEARRWVDETLASLDLRARVAQLVMVWVSGGYAPTSGEEMVRLTDLVETHGIGGIVISLGTPHAYVAKLNYLQERAELPLLVAADFEAGAGARLGGIYAVPSMMDMGGATELPPAMAFGAIGEERFVHEAGRITGVEARALGVHLNFAPVLDVNSNPDNPIINTRSFGEDAGAVASLGEAFVSGARVGGLMTTAKHFPGHGDTRSDSHLELPAIGGDRDRLERVELVPFRRAVEAGVDAIMTAHVAAPSILGPDAPPATLSAYFMTELLRTEIGFEGLLFTDALDMGAIVNGFGPEEAAVRALEAGADVMLMPPDPPGAIAGVVAAVQSGRLSESRIEDSVRRLLELKARAGLPDGRRVDPEQVAEIVGSANHVAFADTAARRSITLVRDLPGLVPFDSTAPGRILSITYTRDGDLAAGRIFDQRLEEWAEVLDPARVTASTRQERFDSLAVRADSADLVLLSAYVPPRSSVGSLDLSPELISFTEELERRGRAPIVLSFGSPYLLSSLPDAGTYLVAWGGQEVAQRAAADALFGRAPISGRLPISLPPYHERGEGLQRPVGSVPETGGDEPEEAGIDAAAQIEAETSAIDTEEVEVVPEAVGMDATALERVDRMLQTAIADSVTPGAALAIGRHGRLVRLRGYGRLDWDPAASPVNDSTIYDLASLTKVVGTTTAILQLVDADRVALRAPVGRYLSEWSEGWKASVTVRDLLIHQGGLPPFRPFWRDISGREAYRRAIDALEPAYLPGERTVYSDLGFITLAFVAEQVSGEPLDRWLQQSLFAPLGLRETGYMLSEALHARVAPTEIDTVFRHQHLRGVVHDENAYALGGVAGHAGLFSSVRDLAVFAQRMLEGARGVAVESPFPTTESISAAVLRQTESSSRALGWDTPSEGSSAGSFLTESAFGHTGFTGTSIWVDPELDLFVVLLTNRVNPTRENRGHVPLRRAVHDVVATSIRDVPIERRR
jgi:beta-glucosidase-like glycosyl hydrolase/CubicO group peptidase (beta-lactamase class C family)